MYGHGSGLAAKEDTQQTSSHGGSQNPGKGHWPHRVLHLVFPWPSVDCTSRLADSETPPTPANRWPKPPQGRGGTTPTQKPQGLPTPWRSRGFQSPDDVGRGVRPTSAHQIATRARRKPARDTRRKITGHVPHAHLGERENPQQNTRSRPTKHGAVRNPHDSGELVSETQRSLTAENPLHVVHGLG